MLCYAHTIDFANERLFLMFTLTEKSEAAEQSLQLNAPVS